jgi:hypothetical protein
MLNLVVRKETARLMIMKKTKRTYG